MSHEEAQGHMSVHSATTPSKVNFDQRPMLVFWEVTRACQLACKHCRANAMAGSLPGELTHEQGLDLIEQVAGFGRPYPILVLTGGDCLLRPDIWELVAASRARGIPTAEHSRHSSETGRSMSSAPDTTKTAASAARSPARRSPTKSG